MSSQLEAYNWQALPDKYVIGVDEVGRGCLAGPVYASAVILSELPDYSDINDSKSMSAKRRKELSEKIKTQHIVSIAFASVEEIEQHNILVASLLAMKRAVEGLNVNLLKAHILVDGKFTIPGFQQKIQQTALIKGDSRAHPIAAASIVAKVTRDELLMSLSKEFPQYGLEKHKGYCTKAHKEAIEKYGPASIHRKTFKGVREHL